MRAFIGFAGFGGPEIALREFGFQPVGVEIDDAIAGVNRRNGGGISIVMNGELKVELQGEEWYNICSDNHSIWQLFLCLLVLTNSCLRAKRLGVYSYLIGISCFRMIVADQG